MKSILLTTFVTFILNISSFAQPAELLSAAAKAEFEKQNFAPCIAEISKLIVRQPKNDAALVERARCLYLSADDANDEKVILAEVSKKILDKEKARSAVIDEVLSRRNKAVDDATKAIALNPRNANAFNIRGLIKSSLGKKEKAESIADFDKAIEIDPKFIKPYSNRGAAKTDASDFDGAIADYTKVIELDPNNIAAMENRVMAMIRKNQARRSIEVVSELRKIIKLAPTHEVNFMLAGGECFKFDYDYECVDIFEQYTKAFPKSAYAFINLGWANGSVEFYHNIENRESYWKAAETAYLRFIELEPNDIAAYVQLFDLYFDKLRSKVNAKVMAIRTLAKFPNNPRSYILSGKMAESNGDWVMAVTEFSRAIELKPTFSLAYERRSNAYLGLKDDNKALADLNKAIELDRDNGSAYLNRGNFYSKYKKYPEASFDFGKADTLKETCAKTYRGIMFSTIAKENNEARDTGNFLNAQRDFLADDAQKCYLTHFMYGLSLSSQGFNDQAAQQFGYAVNVYKKQGYDPTEVIEWQNRANTASAKPPTNSGNSSSDEVQELIAAFTSESIKQGATLVDSGVYQNSGSYNRTLNVEPGKTYVIIAATTYDPNTFGFRLTYNDRFPVLETNAWNDNAYEISADAEYGMKVRTSKVGNLSVREMNFSTTKKSSVKTIQLITTGTKGKIQWICFRLQ